jgi:hypothetical protein
MDVEYLHQFSQLFRSVYGYRPTSVIFRYVFLHITCLVVCRSLTKGMALISKGLNETETNSNEQGPSWEAGQAMLS